MVDIQALNALIAGISIAVAVVVGVAMSTIVLVWVADRRRHAQHVAGGVGAIEEHLAEAARSHTAR